MASLEDELGISLFEKEGHNIVFSYKITTLYIVALASININY